MKKTKIYAAYLPQFHETEDNNKFWGKGFTDWVGVKKSEPLFIGHHQPKVPLNDYYYDLSKVDAIKWQAELARKYKIDGFNIYHYWFKNGHKTLQTPAENLLKHSEIDIGFFFSWDNTSWVRSWGNISGNAWAPSFDGEKQNSPVTLLEFSYGNEKDWKDHFDYLLPFFEDKRYLKIDNKPVFALMRTSEDETLKKMHDYWNAEAIRAGFAGITMLTNVKMFGNYSLLDGQFTYEPRYSAWGKREAVDVRLDKYLHIKKKQKGYRYDYEQVWKKIIKNAKCNKNKNIMFGATVGFDDTPRRGEKARILINASANLFEKYFSQLYRISCHNNKELLFITAWNEWGEGACLEPDTENGYAYLEALKKAVESVDAENV